MEDFRQQRLIPVISEVVAAEISDAPEHVQALYRDILARAPEVIGVSTEALTLADIYQRRGILTPKFYDDGIHMTKIAIKTIEMTRAIRDKHAAQLQHTSPAERIAFYRKKAQQMQTYPNVSPDTISVPYKKEAN